MKTCTYISGPPCAGKSTVAAVVFTAVEGLVSISGDRFWVTHAHLPFDQRVAATNRDLLAALAGTDAANVLCEWVPWHRPFVEALLATCTRQRRLLLHVVLTAPLSVLKERKMTRDGDQDVVASLSPVALPAGDAQMVFNSDTDQPTEIAALVAGWILSAGSRLPTR